MGRLFGTDGVRGIANRDLTGELAYGIGRATVAVVGDARGARPRVVVGRDTRASGEFLEAALGAGICSAGGDALMLGVSTTPQVAFSTSELGADAGVVISASHNPAQYNGIKVFGAMGYKLPDPLEDRLERLVETGEAPRPSGRDIGRIVPVAQVRERYLEHLRATAQAPLRGMRLVVDCANGAASTLAPELLRRLGADVVAINDRPNGWNINEEGGATAPDVVARAVKEEAADAGVALDGDADRAIFADHEGGVIDGDQVLAACALALKAEGDLARDLLVVTVMANLGLRLRMAEAGVRVVETKVGDRYVLEEMRRSGAILGGEQSGHVIFLRHATTGDGLLTAVQFLTLAARKAVSVKELASCMRRFPQVLESIAVREARELERAEGVWRSVRSAEEALGRDGRVLVRASGTEPVVRVMVEAPTDEDARRHAQAISSSVRDSLA